MVKEVVLFSLTVMLLGEMLPPLVAVVDTKKVDASSIVPLDELELLALLDELDALELLDEESELMDASLDWALSPPPPQPISVANIATDNARQNIFMPITIYLSSPFHYQQQVSSESEVILSHPLKCHVKR